MKLRLGMSPISWSNDDLPQLGGDTPLEVCLSETREAGFVGTETGGKFPKEAGALSAQRCLPSMIWRWCRAGTAAR